MNLMLRAVSGIARVKFYVLQTVGRTRPLTLLISRNKPHLSSPKR
jgi:hypothetical protein